MTESDIGSGSHREPSSASLDIVKLKERHMALKSDMSELRDSISDIRELLVGHISNSDSRHAQLLATFNQHNLEDAVVHQRVLTMKEELKSLQEESKRDPVTFWTSIAAAGTAAGAILTAIFGGGKP